MLDIDCLEARFLSTPTETALQGGAAPGQLEDALAELAEAQRAWEIIRVPQAGGGRGGRTSECSWEHESIYSLFNLSNHLISLGILSLILLDIEWLNKPRPCLRDRAEVPGARRLCCALQHTKHGLSDLRLLRSCNEQCFGGGPRIVGGRRGCWGPSRSNWAPGWRPVEGGRFGGTPPG